MQQVVPIVRLILSAWPPRLTLRQAPRGNLFSGMIRQQKYEIWTMVARPREE